MGFNVSYEALLACSRDEKAETCRFLNDVRGKDSETRFKKWKKTAKSRDEENWEKFKKVEGILEKARDVRDAKKKRDRQIEIIKQVQRFLNLEFRETCNPDRSYLPYAKIEKMFREFRKEFSLEKIKKYKGECKALEAKVEQLMTDNEALKAKFTTENEALKAKFEECEGKRDNLKKFSKKFSLKQIEEFDSAQEKLINLEKKLKESEEKREHLKRLVNTLQNSVDKYL